MNNQSFDPFSNQVSDNVNVNDKENMVENSDIQHVNINETMKVSENNKKELNNNCSEVNNEHVEVSKDMINNDMISGKEYINTQNNDLDNNEILKKTADNKELKETNDNKELKETNDNKELKETNDNEEKKDDIDEQQKEEIDDIDAEIERAMNAVEEDNNKNIDDSMLIDSDIDDDELGDLEKNGNDDDNNSENLEDDDKNKNETEMDDEEMELVRYYQEQGIIPKYGDTDFKPKMKKRRLITKKQKEKIRSRLQQTIRGMTLLLPTKKTNETKKSSLIVSDMAKQFLEFRKDISSPATGLKTNSVEKITTQVANEQTIVDSKNTSNTLSNKQTSSFNLVSITNEKTVVESNGKMCVLLDDSSDDDDSFEAVSLPKLSLLKKFAPMESMDMKPKIPTRSNSMIQRKNLISQLQNRNREIALKQSQLTQINLSDDENDDNDENMPDVQLNSKTSTNVTTNNKQMNTADRTSVNISNTTTVEKTSNNTNRIVSNNNSNLNNITNNNVTTNINDDEEQSTSRVENTENITIQSNNGTEAVNNSLEKTESVVHYQLDEDNEKDSRRNFRNTLIMNSDEESEDDEYDNDDNNSDDNQDNDDDEHVESLIRRKIEKAAMQQLMGNDDEEAEEDEGDEEELYLDESEKQQLLARITPKQWKKFFKRMFVDDSAGDEDGYLGILDDDEDDEEDDEELAKELAELLDDDFIATQKEQMRSMKIWSKDEREMDEETIELLRERFLSKLSQIRLKRRQARVQIMPGCQDKQVVLCDKCPKRADRLGMPAKEARFKCEKCKNHVFCEECWTIWHPLRNRKKRTHVALPLDIIEIDISDDDDGNYDEEDLKKQQALLKLKLRHEEEKQWELERQRDNPLDLDGNSRMMLTRIKKRSIPLSRSRSHLKVLSQEICADNSKGPKLKKLKRSKSSSTELIKSLGIPLPVPERSQSFNNHQKYLQKLTKGGRSNSVAVSSKQGFVFAHHDDSKVESPQQNKRAAAAPSDFTDLFQSLSQSQSTISEPPLKRSRSLIAAMNRVC